MSFNYNNFNLYSNYNKRASESNNNSRNTRPFTEESSFGHKILYIKRDIPKQIIGHSISINPDLVGKNIDTFQSFDFNTNNTSINDKTVRPKSIFYKNKQTIIPKIKLSKRTPSHKYNLTMNNITHTYTNTNTNIDTPKKYGHYTHHHTLTSTYSLNTENKLPSFCLVNASKYKKQNMKLYLPKTNNNMYKTTIQSSNDDNAHFRSFTNQTLSSLIKIDKPLFKFNNKFKEELKESLSSQHNKEILINTNRHKKLDTKEIVMKQLIQVLNDSNNYGVTNQFGSRKIVNYVHQMEKELKKDIRQKELYVKETMDSLKRLQRNNDELASKVAFAITASKK